MKLRSKTLSDDDPDGFHQAVHDEATANQECEHCHGFWLCSKCGDCLPSPDLCPKCSPTVTVPRDEWERMQADAAKWRRIEPDAIDFNNRMKSLTEAPPGLRKIIEAIRGVLEFSEHRTVRIYCRQAGNYWYAHFDEIGCFGHGDTIFNSLRNLVQVAAHYHHVYQGIPESSLNGTVLDRRNASNRFFDEWVNPNSLAQPNAAEGK